MCVPDSWDDMCPQSNTTSIDEMLIVRLAGWSGNQMRCLYDSSNLFDVNLNNLDDVTEALEEGLCDDVDQIPTSSPTQ